MKKNPRCIYNYEIPPQKLPQVDMYGNKSRTVRYSNPINIGLFAGTNSKNVDSAMMLAQKLIGSVNLPIQEQEVESMTAEEMALDPNENFQTNQDYALNPDYEKPSELRLPQERFQLVAMFNKNRLLEMFRAPDKMFSADRIVRGIERELEIQNKSSRLNDTELKDYVTEMVYTNVPDLDEIIDYVSDPQT